MVVPAADTPARQIASLNRASGSVVDILTVGGRETHLLLQSVSDGVLTGHPVDLESAQPAADETLTIPFTETALLYYTEPAGAPKNTHAADTGRLAFPAKYSYPELPSVGSAEKKYSCAQLDLELSRAEALRWFARNEGLMGYTPGQELAHHAVTTAIVVGVTFAIVAASAGGGTAGGFPNFSGPPAPQQDPRSSLRALAGDGTLRWAITAADVRVAGLLRLKRDRSCAARSTLTDAAGDLQILRQFDALQTGSAPQKLSGVGLLHEQTRLLDSLGPRPLPDGSLGDCGAFHCDTRTDQSETSAPVVEAVRDMPELAQERVQRVFSHAVWFGEKPSVYGRAMSVVRNTSPTGNLVIFDKSLVFTGSAGVAPPVRIRISYTDVASVELGSFGPNRWVAVHTRDGQTHFFTLMQQGGGLDRSQTRVAGLLLQSDLRAPGH
jgi:hypothetical protein